MMKKGELLSKAILIATNAHHGQFDKGGNPYILHPLAVMGLIEDADEELQSIAVLHDVIEDTKVTWQDLKEAGMTDRIIVAVRLLTKMPGQTYEEYKEGVFSNVDAMRVKKADLTHNSDIRRLKGISERDIERMAKYHRFYLEIQSRLANQ
jgi:GTP diphosphokinase / guanosine-3',5'-bis(diphosphate) 3'-diphosphatase